MKYFPPLRLEIKYLLVGVSKLINWCVGVMVFAASLWNLSRKRKKKEERFLGEMVKMGTLAWQLNVRFSRLAAKTRHQN